MGERAPFCISGEPRLPKIDPRRVPNFPHADHVEFAWVKGIIARNGVRACQLLSQAFSEWTTIRSEAETTQKL